MVDFETYHRRINAMNYALTHDDGISMDYDDAEMILVGVSRAGKTPTCVYLALHYGIRAANYPLTEEDLEADRLPPRLRPYRHKLFGLTIDPVRLQQIRQERRPNSRYAQLETCRREVAAAERMFRNERIPVLSTTHTSIEEIASKVLTTLGHPPRDVLMACRRAAPRRAGRDLTVKLTLGRLRLVNAAATRDSACRIGPWQVSPRVARIPRLSRFGWLMGLYAENHVRLARLFAPADLAAGSYVPASATGWMCGWT